MEIKMNKKRDISPESIAIKVETEGEKTKRVKINNLAAKIKDNEEKLTLLGADIAKKDHNEIVEVMTLGDDDNLYNSADIFPEMKTMVQKGRYSMEVRSLAHMYMEAFRNENTEKMTPMYALVSRVMGIPETTLRNWWADREKFDKVRTSVHGKAMEYAQDKMLTTVLQMMHSLGRRDFDAMDDKNFAYILNMLINKYRLFSGLSTNNVSVRGRIRLEDGVPDDR